MTPADTSADALLVGGKVCLVTGAAQGIGFEVASALARHGAKVVIADIGASLDGTGGDPGRAEHAAARVRAEGGACVAQATDVTDAGQADRAVDVAVEEFGRLDVVVNVAGTLRRGSVLETSLDDLRSAFAVHVEGAFHTTRAAARHWQAHPGEHRRVVNFSSDAGLLGELDYAAYAVAKAAVVALTLSTAPAVAPLGATANVFIPQALTRMTMSIPMDELPDSDRSRWEEGEFDAVNVPPAVVFLASDAADHVTGQVIGGWGYEVHRYALAHRARTLRSDGPWDLRSLFTQITTLVDD